MKLQKLVFIINPASGSGKNKPGTREISDSFDRNKFEVQVHISEAIGHAGTLAGKAIQEGATAVIAVGGDGTVNEIAAVLNGSNCALGIIPCGSGNGLARHHRIPMNFGNALEVIQRMKVIEHDAALINGRPSFNVSGIGFDAHVAHLFGKNGQRGFSNYIRLVLKEFNAYQEQEILVKTSSGTFSQPVMMAAVATASQFGNNAVIAPEADANDGISNLTLVRKMNAFLLPGFMYRVFNRKVKNSKHAKLLRDEKFQITCCNPMPLHIDGEPAGFHSEYNIETMKGSLKIIVP